MAEHSQAQKAVFQVIIRVLGRGRQLFLGLPDAALPEAQSELIRSDDRILQPGFVSDSYRHGELLVIGINAGLGGRVVRTPGDEAMMPALHALAEAPSFETFRSAMLAQKSAFPSWPASRELLDALKVAAVTTDHIAYLNALPYRVGRGTAQSAFPSAERKRLAAKYWVRPLLDALEPAVIVAHGQVAAEVIRIAEIGSPHPEPITFDRTRVAAWRRKRNADFVEKLKRSLVVSRTYGHFRDS